MTVKRGLILCAGLLLLVFARGAAAPQDEDVKPLLAQLEKAGGLKEHPDANALVVFEDYRSDYEEDGRFTSREHSLVKILTDKGRQDLATRKVPYHKRYNTVRVPLARVIKKDGRVVPVPPESIKDGTMAETQQMNILEENFRRLNITIPQLETGDAVELIIETVSQPLIKNHYNDILVFQGLEPILRKEAVISGPASRPLRFVVKNGRLDFSKSEKDGRLIYSWKAVNQPKIDLEPAMVSVADVALKVVASTFKDWEELSRYGASLNVGKTEPSEALRAKVRELVQGLTTDEERIMAVFRYVSQKIRYMGSSMDLGAFIEPHPAAYTFEKQYGVCRDKSLLMMTMLREIGIKSYDTIINISARIEPEIPIIYFEHAICAVVLKDGRTFYMDPTLELSSEFGESYVGGRYVLSLDEKGHGLVRVPPTPAERSLGLIRSETKALEDGGIEGHVRIVGKGFYDFALRSISKSVPAYQFPMIWQQLGQILTPGIKVENVKPTDFADLTKPYEIGFDFKAAGYAVDAGRLRMFKVPLASFAFDVISIGIFQALTDRPERQYPIFLFTPRGSVQEERIAIPAGWSVKAVPDPIEAREGPIRLSLSAQAEAGAVVFRSDFRIEKSSLDPNDYQSLRKVVRKLKRFQKGLIILEKAEPARSGGLR